MDLDVYLRRREQQERVAALQAKCLGARVAHLHMAECYRERLRARRIASLRIDLPIQEEHNVGPAAPALTHISA